MKDFQVKIVFDDDTDTINRYFETKSGMFEFVNTMRNTYRIRAVSVAESYIVCNAVNGEFRYG